MNERYDTIVVGSGSAGAVLAARLTEDPARRLLLLDAGPDYTGHGSLPADLANGNVMSLEAHDWHYRADIHDGRRIHFPRGKVTGGSSAVGATIALRGTPDDYDEWAALGNPDWSYSSVLPYLRRLENDLDFGGEYHGHGGPIPIRRWRPDELTPGQHAFRDACLRAGYPEVDDHNHPRATGVGPIPSNRRGAATDTRFSTAMGYLAPVRDRANLTVRTRTTVAHLLFDGTTVVGVHLTDPAGGAGDDVFADRVVLAAGAIGTPAILLRSGIGPADDLRRLGVDVRADRPGVGANLIDHPRSGVFLVPREGTYDQSEPFLQTILRTTAAGSEQTNDMQYYMVNHFDLSPFPALQMLAAAPVIFGVMLVVQRPYSRGRLRLTSVDPKAAPDIDLNYLADERDLKTLIDGIRTCWELANHPDILGLGEEFVAIRNERVIASDTMLRQYIITSLDSAYHPVGTARMGTADDPMSVVDQHGRAHSVDNLYVGDASIMPNIVRANTNLTTIMIGERLADHLA